MFIILAYDISHIRVGKVMKICRKYLFHVQKSVFEGHITERTLGQMKEELFRIIEPEEDSVCIYRMNSTRYTQKEQLGIIERYSHII